MCLQAQGTAERGGREGGRRCASGDARVPNAARAHQRQHSLPLHPFLRLCWEGAPPARSLASAALFNESMHELLGCESTHWSFTCVIMPSSTQLLRAGGTSCGGSSAPTHQSSQVGNTSMIDLCHDGGCAVQGGPPAETGSKLRVPPGGGWASTAGWAGTRARACAVQLPAHLRVRERLALGPPLLVLRFRPDLSNVGGPARLQGRRTRQRARWELAAGTALPLTPMPAGGSVGAGSVRQRQGAPELAVSIYRAAAAARCVGCIGVASASYRQAAAPRAGSRCACRPAHLAPK